MIWRSFLFAYALTLASCASAFVTVKAWPLESYFDFPVIVTVFSISAIVAAATMGFATRIGRVAVLAYAVVFPALWFILASLVLKAILYLYAIFGLWSHTSIDVSNAYLRASMFGVWVAWGVALIFGGVTLLKVPKEGLNKSPDPWSDAS